MRANEVKLLDFIKKSPQLIVPIYQRNYSWERKECRQLWNDIIKAGSDDDIRGHFIGSIVYTQEQDFQVSDNDPLLVIDGQQRLTSVMLIIAGLVEMLDEETHSEWFNAKRFQDFYLFNPHESGEMRYKLLLSKTDKQTLASIVSQKDLPSSDSKKIKENYRFFKELITLHQDDKQIIFKGLRKLVVVDIALNRNQDNPQLIFESMNSKGRPLCQADLIRNYVLMGLNPEIQKRLYKELCYPMEEEFGQQYYNKHFDKFMRYYLTMKERTIPKESEVYSSFKEFVVKNGYDIEEVIKEIRKFSSHYCKMVLKGEGDPELKPVFNDLNELKVTAVYPFFLEIYDYYFDKKLPIDHFIEIVRLVESYIFRRSVCSIPTNTINKTFAKLTKDIPNDKKNIQYVKASMLKLVF